MTWQERLKELEDQKQWEDAIDYMEDIIEEHPDNMQAYLFMEYLLMNLLVEEDYNFEDQGYYASLAKKYFEEGYEKFKNNSEFLYWTGWIGVMSPWFFGIDDGCYFEDMIKKAVKMDPNNVVYEWQRYLGVEEKKDSELLREALLYCKLILQVNSPLKVVLDKKGSMGQCMYGMMVHWADRLIKQYG